MRVIAGKSKGLKLTAPATQKVRPATDKVKEALFNILGDIEGVQVLDLFAGTGSVGIEALSREAAHCTFVESDRHIASFIKKNLEHCHLNTFATILTTSVPAALSYLARKKNRFDLVFVDPPYDRRYVNLSLSLLEKFALISQKGLIVVEHSPREIPQSTESLKIIDERQYGQTFVTFLKKI